jgi:ectoine hydroxylase-related dioxygenase (phytanoyl-CoA dioxygenase family)
MTVIPQDQIETFQKEGYMLLPNIIPPDHLETLRAECDRYIDVINAEMDEAGVDVLDLNHRDKRYFIAKRYPDSAGLTQFLFSDLMADVCRATLGDNAYLFLDQFVVKMAEVGMSFSWHQDSGYIDHPHRPYLTCWCTLDDVTETNGTVYLLPFSKAPSRERIEHTVDPATNDRVGYTGDEPGIPVILPAGSIAFFWSTILHRSGPNTSNQRRRVLLAQYSAEPMLEPDGTPRVWVEPILRDGQRVSPNNA